MTGKETAVVAHRQISEGRGNTKLYYFLLWEQIYGFSFGSYVEETVEVLPVIKYVYSWKRKNNHGMNLWSHWTHCKKESNQDSINYKKTKKKQLCTDCSKQQKSRYQWQFKKKCHKPQKYRDTSLIFLILHICDSVKCLIFLLWKFERKIPVRHVLFCWELLQNTQFFPSTEGQWVYDLAKFWHLSQLFVLQPWNVSANICQATPRWLSGYIIPEDSMFH